MRTTLDRWHIAMSGHADPDDPPEDDAEPYVETEPVEVETGEAGA